MRSIATDGVAWPIGLSVTWNRVTGHWVTGSATLAGSGQVTGQCVRPSV